MMSERDEHIYIQSYSENKRLREALRILLDCGNAIIGARTDDPDAAEAFEMYDDARLKARRALALSSHQQGAEK